MKNRTGWLCAAALSVLAACFGPAPGPSGGGTPPGATPMGMLSERDPIGFLLQWRDSIGIGDTTALQLSRLNLRLFRRNNEVQMKMDTVLRSNGIDPRGSRDAGPIPDAVRQQLVPLHDQMVYQTAAYRDTARAMLSVEQRDRADSLQAHLRAMFARQGQGAGPSGQPRP